MENEKKQSEPIMDFHPDTPEELKTLLANFIHTQGRLQSYILKHDSHKEETNNPHLFAAILSEVYYTNVEGYAVITGAVSISKDDFPHAIMAFAHEMHKKRNTN